MIIYSGNNHIPSLCLYSSESCSQVFTIVLVWLMTVVENLPREELSKIVIGYDNMCHLDALKVARKPLPIPPPYNRMWMSVTKVHMPMFLYIYPVLNQFNCMIIVGD